MLEQHQFLVIAFTDEGTIHHSFTLKATDNFLTSACEKALEENATIREVMAWELKADRWLDRKQDIAYSTHRPF